MNKRSSEISSRVSKGRVGEIDIHIQTGSGNKEVDSFITINESSDEYIKKIFGLNQSVLAAWSIAICRGEKPPTVDKMGNERTFSGWPEFVTYVLEIMSLDTTVQKRS